MVIGSSGLLRPKTAGNSEKTVDVLLFFLSRKRCWPRISAENERPFADNFLEEQRKQRA
jgi:hypothetical protein